MSDALEDILVARRRDLKRAKEHMPQADLEKKVRGARVPASFYGAVHRTGQITLIAEMKRRSPSAGLIRDPYNVVEIARAYEKGGAGALSVLTETAKFEGSIDDIRQVREVTDLPILRKDFIFDPYQIYEARAFGADAALLIADSMDPSLLKELVSISYEIQLEPLVEVFTSDALPSAINSGARMLGINSRNLRTLHMNPDNVFGMAPLIPRDRVIVAESGIRSVADIERLKSLRVSGVLVGESLLKQSDLELAARELVKAGSR